MPWQQARVQIDSIGLPRLNIAVVFYMLRDWLHWIAHLECHCNVLHALKACQGTDWLQWIALVGHAYLVVQASEACQSTAWLRAALGATHWTFLLCFYTLSRHAILQIDSIGLFTRFGGMPGYRLTPSDCPHWTCLLCSTSFGRMLGYILIPLDCPHWLEAC